MKSTVKSVVKKVPLELIYDVVDERTKDIKKESEQLRQEQKDDFKFLVTHFDQLRQEYKDDFKSINARIDQIHSRLDQIMHMISNLHK